MKQVHEFSMDDGQLDCSQQLTLNQRADVDALLMAVLMDATCNCHSQRRSMAELNLLPIQWAQHKAWISPSQRGWLTEKSGKWYGNLTIYLPTYDARVRKGRHVRFLLAEKAATRTMAAQRMLSTEVEKIKMSGRSRYKRFEREGHILLISQRQKGWLSEKSGKWYGNASVCFLVPGTNSMEREQVQFLLTNETKTPKLMLKGMLNMRVARLKLTG